MPEVKINFRDIDYTVTCDPGQEDRLQALAAQFNEKAQDILAALNLPGGQITDNRLMLLLGLTLCDELADAKAQLEAMKLEKGLMPTESVIGLVEKTTDKIATLTTRLDQ